MKPIVSPSSRIRHPQHFEIGDYSIVDDFCYISTRIRIGICSHLASGCTIGGGAAQLFTLGDFASVGSGVRIYCTSSDFTNGLLCLLPAGVRVDDVQTGFVEGDVSMGDCSAIGVNSVVMPGNDIPEGTAIGALSFVPSRFTFEPWSLYAGVPIRRIRGRNRPLITQQVAILRARIDAARHSSGER